MRMTIEESIEIIEQNINIGASKVDCALEMAIDTMRKYQKMQEVLERIWNIPSHLINKEECLDRIMETYREVR